MFTGIIEEIGEVIKAQTTIAEKYVTIACTEVQKGLKVGDSIACNGVCLSVCEVDPNFIVAEISDQTCRVTTARNWRKGYLINLERAVAVGQRLNGHIVQGHIDTTTKLHSQEGVHGTLYLHFKLPENYAHLVVERGSIAIDGVSLTIASLKKNTFAVAIIKLTLSNTILSQLNVGKEVNLEFDIIGKYVNRRMQTPETTPITQEWLDENGF